MVLSSFFLISCGASESDGKGHQLSVKTSVETKEDKKNEKDGQSLSLPPEIRARNASSLPMDQNSGGLESLKGLKGVNIESAFSEKLRDEGKRFERLEKAFLDLHRQFKTLEPAIIRLVAIEEDMKNLTNLLSENLEITQTPPVPLVEEDIILKSQEAEKTEDAKQEPSSGSAPAGQLQNIPTPRPVTKDQKKLSDIRVGRHPEFTRVVIDLQQDTPYETSFDATYKKFIIKVRDAVWTGQERQDYLTHKLLNYYTVEPLEGGDGTQIHLYFKEPVILKQEELLKQKAQPALRIVLDFKIR